MTLTRRAFLGVSAAGLGLAASKSSGLDGLLNSLFANERQKSKLYALLIYPRNDSQFVSDLYKFLREQGLSEEQIELLYLLGQKTQWHIPHIKIVDGATRNGLYKAAERLKVKALPQDTLFIYFQHHGTLDSITNNGEPSIELRWEYPGDNNYFIPVSEFTNIIRQVHAKRVMLLTGQCYGYDFGTKFRGLLPEREVTVFTFAPPGKQAYDTQSDISMMFRQTHITDHNGLRIKPAILKDLRYDVNGDGYISLKEAIAGIKKERTANSPQVLGPDFYFPRKILLN